jgi:hypothetical protein
MGPFSSRKTHSNLDIGRVKILLVPLQNTQHAVQQPACLCLEISRIERLVVGWNFV